MKFTLIAAIGKNNELGKNNGLLWDLPLDTKHFKDTTRERAVIMGQRTFESLGTGLSGEPGRPLPNRRNIILTRDTKLRRDGIEVVYSIKELMNLLKKTAKVDEEIFVIGGGQIYGQFIKIADNLDLTHVDGTFSNADTFFPEFNQSEWKIVSEEFHPKDEKHLYNFTFKKYERI